MSGIPREMPDDFRGVWVRMRRQTSTDQLPPDVDEDSWVRWLQTSQWYGDLRVPACIMACRVAKPLNELSPAQQAGLALQQGYVGITQYEPQPEGPACTRLRRVDYQPPSLQQPDSGMLIVVQPDRLIKCGGQDEGDYNETWERLPDSMGRYIALAGCDELGRDDGRRLLVAGSYMMVALPRQVRWPRGLKPGYTLADIMLSHPGQVCDWLDCDISFGRLAPGQASGQALGQWSIERSTLPQREGQRWPVELVRESEPMARVTLGEQTGPWHVLEWSCDADRLTV